MLWEAAENAKGVDLSDRSGFHSFRRTVVNELLEWKWFPKHVDQFVGMTPQMVLEVYGQPTEDSLNGMADVLS